MANLLYPSARSAFLGQNPSLDWDTDDIHLMLVDSAQPYVSTDDMVDDLNPSYIIARSGPLTTPTTVDGVADADDVVFTTPAAGYTCNLIIYKDAGVSDDSVNQLIAFIDTGSGLPYTTNGADVTVVWDDGANKIFKL